MWTWDHGFLQILPWIVIAEFQLYSKVRLCTTYFFHVPRTLTCPLFNLLLMPEVAAKYMEACINRREIKWKGDSFGCVSCNWDLSLPLCLSCTKARENYYERGLLNTLLCVYGNSADEKKIILLREMLKFFSCHELSVWRVFTTSPGKSFLRWKYGPGTMQRVHDQGDLSSERILAVVELGEMDAAKRDDQCQDHEKPQQH